MKTKILSILALLLTVTQGAWAAEAFTGSGSGTPGDPYVISNNEDYWAFVHNVNDGTFTTQYFKLNYSPHSIASSIGNADHPFQGHFDGNGNTAGLSINTENSYVALFAYASGATIENLHVNGTVNTSNIYAAGLIANATNVTITNCRSSVTINSSYNGGGGHAGFVGLAAGTITITGCLFDGTLATTNGTTQCSGFIGWSDATTTAITNSLCVPASVTSGMEGYDFVRPLHSPAVTNSYASESFNVSYRHGKILRSISAGTDVSSLAISGASTEYSVSGITAYATGIKYNDVYYAGNGESVSLALSHADAAAGFAFNQYAVAGGGTLTAQTETSATLSMTDANQTINATWTPTYTATFATGSGGTGWTIAPTSGVEGTTVTVSYNGENKVKSVTVKAMTLSGLKTAINAASDLSDLKAMYLGKYVTAAGTLQGTSTGAIGVVAYISKSGVDADYADSRILVLALTDANSSCTWQTTNTSVCSTDEERTRWKNTESLYGYNFSYFAHNYESYPANYAVINYSASRPSGACLWFMPTRKQWELMYGAVGNNTPDTMASAANLENGGYYWAATESTGFEWAAFRFCCSASNTLGDSAKSTEYRARAVFAF